MAIDFESIQNTIGYHFNNEDLLQQAFVRRSYSEEKGGQNNEVLEFIGDKALDLAVIIILMYRFGAITDNKDYKEFKLRNPKYFNTKLNEGQFTDIKKDLVKKGALADSMDKLGFNTQLIMGKGDIYNNIQNSTSVKEDLFEAIIGAVAVDSDYDMDKITDVVYNMIDFDAYFNNDYDNDNNYVALLQTWFQRNGYGLPNYKYIEHDDCFECNLYTNINEGVINKSGFGSSIAKARMDCARIVYELLLDNNLIPNEFKAAVGEPNYDNSLRQINELRQKKLIEEPIYKFKQVFDNDNNLMWECTLSINNVDKSFVNSGYQKKDAQRDCAFEMLQYLMDEYEGE